MAINKGKAFEAIFKADWKKSFPKGTIDRLYDQVSGYKTISNISDFLGYNYPFIYYLECKSHKGGTWNFDNLTQYDKLCTKIGIKGVMAGVVLWMIERDLIVYLPITTIKKMKEDGLKSFNVKNYFTNPEEYDIIKVPSIKKRAFMQSDYRILNDWAEKHCL